MNICERCAQILLTLFPSHEKSMIEIPVTGLK